MDVVVADAAIQALKPLPETEDRDWHDVIDNNLNGSANTLRAFAPLLVKNGKGWMILFSSMQGRYGTKNGAAYSAPEVGDFRADEVGRAGAGDAQNHGERG